MPRRRNEKSHDAFRESRPYSDNTPETPPDSRTATLEKDEDVNATKRLPFRAGSDLFEEPDSDTVVLGNERNRVIFKPRNQLQQTARNNSSTFTENTRSRQSTDPFITSPPPPTQGATNSIPFDFSTLQNLFNLASEKTGNTYGPLTIENNASVLQGNLYSGKVPPIGMRKHTYGATTTRGRDDGRPNLIQGDASADAILETGLWHSSAGRTPLDIYHDGSQYGSAKPASRGRRHKNQERTSAKKQPRHNNMDNNSDT